MEKLQFKTEIKDESIRLRLTKDEKKIIKDLAAEKGLKFKIKEYILI